MGFSFPSTGNTDDVKVLIYQSEDGITPIDVKMEDETVWLTQAQLCELYQSIKSNISEHIIHIFEEVELEKESVVRKKRNDLSTGGNHLQSLSTITCNADCIY